MMRMQSSFANCLSVVLLILLITIAACTARAQSAGGGILGIVVDPSAATLSGATVTATNIATGLKRDTVTGADGIFRFTALDPGQYRLEIVAQGFKKLTREPIDVRVTETTDLQRVALAVGAMTETVNVTEEAPLLQTAEATLGKVFDTRMVVDLPLVTRNYTQLLSLQPGVVSDIPNAAAFGNGTTGFSVAGSRYYDNSVLINGINAMGSTTQAGPLAGVAIPAPDTISEFKVQTQQYSAEFGRAGGASVNLVTKSGTNAFHGSLYEFFRNEALNANEYFFKRNQIANGQANEAPILRQNQFGGTVGGPIRKGKTFFFGSYQGTRQINGAAPGLVLANAVYPLLPPGDRSDDAAFRTALGAIYGGRTGLFGGSVSGGVPTNYILPDGSNINPVAIKILQAKLPNGSYLLPSFAQSSLNDGQGGLNGGQVYSNANFTFPSTFDEDQFSINIDHAISSRQTITGKFFSSRQSSSTPAGDIPGFTFETLPQNRNLAIAHTFVVSPTLLNELRVGYTRITNPQTRQDPLTAADVGMVPAPDSLGKFPRVDIATAGLDFGADHVVNRSTENMFTYSDTVSKMFGSHSLHFGATFVRHQLNTNQDLVASGQLIVYGFPDFLLGETGAENNLGLSNLLATFASSGSFEKALRFNDISSFVQDDWKVTSKFTVNLGLRWDYFSWPIDTKGRIGSFDRRKIAEGPFGTPPAGGSYSGYTIAKSFVSKNPGSVIPDGVALVNDSGMDGENYKNFGPRIGFAWQPMNRVAVRGGYGIFYPRISAITALADIVGPPFNNTALASFDPYGSLQDPFTFLNLAPDSAYPQWPARQFIPGQQATVFLSPTNPASLNPYVQQWSMSLQYQLGRDYLVEIGYIASRGQRLLNTLAGNQPAIASASNPIRGVTTNTNDATNIQARSPIAGIVSDRGLALTSTNGSSKYDALTASLSKRYSSGLQFLSAFTFGKAADNNSLLSNGDVSNAQPPGDNTNLQHWGLSNFDRKLRSTTSVVYDLPTPWRKSGSLPGKILCGWQVSGIMTFQTGNPTTFLVNQSQSAVKLQGFLTPDLASGKTLSSIEGSGSVKDRLTHYYSSPGIGSPDSAFVLPGPLDYGQLGRGLPIRSPGEKSVDFALSKQIPLRENVNLGFRAEAFNVFNWVNFGAPDTSVSDPGFGVISSTTTAPRILQFALRLSF